MKVFIPSLKRDKIIQTHRLCMAGKVDYLVFVKNNKEADLYMKTLPSKKIVINDHKGLVEQRLFLTKYANRAGLKYYMSLDDVSKHTQHLSLIHISEPTRPY